MESLECKLIESKNFNDDNIVLQAYDNGIAEIILNRSLKHNALDNKMISGLIDSLDYLNDQAKKYHAKYRLLLLKANGKSFCAGADLRHMQSMIDYDYDENYKDAMHLAALLEKLYNFKIPTIAVVSGNAFGGGVGLISCCDLALATKDIKLCLSEVKLGLIPAVISPYVINTIGYKYSKRLMLTAEVIDAVMAEKIGLIDYVVNNDHDLNIQLKNIIKNILANGPEALKQVKNLLNNITDTRKEFNIKKYTADMIAKIRVSKEGQEGLLAFLDKRQPEWVMCKDDK